MKLSSSILFLIIISSVSFAQNNQKVIKIDANDKWKERMNFAKTNFDFEEALKAPGNITQINLRNRKLDYLDRRIGEFRNLEVIDLSGNSLNSLPEEIYLLKNLKTIKLNDNKFTNIPKVLIKLPGLKNLDISRNQIKNIDFDLGQVTSVERISLSGNPIESINFNGINNTIIELSLSYCNLKVLPASISNLKSLKDLNLSNNNLVNLPQNLVLNKSLQNLNLAKNYFGVFPEILFQIEELEVLDISANSIQGFTLQQGARSNLKRLILDQNRINNFVPNGVLSKLEQLFLSLQQVDFLNANLENMSNLRTLTLNYNKLGRIFNIEKLFNLNELEMASVGLTDFPPYLINFKKLNKINFSSNQISSIPNSIGQLVELENINLQKNNISQISENIGNLKKLRWLNLDNNQLTSLPNNLKYCSSLRTLSLRWNIFSDNEKENLTTEFKNMRISF
jgi:Leucine-rich repeat (LRR) protein